MENNSRKIINKLNKLNLDETEYIEIKNLLHPLLKKIPHLIKKSSSTELFFRSRISNSENIEFKSDLSAPPKELITDYQRCNPPFKPMFYASSKRITSILECNPKKGDIVYLSQWNNNENIPINYLLKHNTENEYTKMNFEQEMIISYLETIFTRKVHKSFSSSYKITSAISELITNKFIQDSEYKIGIDGKIGLVYPSVLNIDDSYNTVFYKEFADERLEIYHVMKLKILDRKSNRINFEILDNAWEFIDGKIIWTNDKNQIPKFRLSKNSLQFMYWKGGARIPVQNSEMSEKYIKELMYE